MDVDPVHERARDPALVLADLLRGAAAGAATVAEVAVRAFLWSSLHSIPCVLLSLASWLNKPGIQSPSRFFSPNKRRGIFSDVRLRICM